MLTLLSSTISAQTVALKTNALYLATTTPNLGVEVSLNRRMTAQIYYGLNMFSFKDSQGAPMKAKHWVLMPEVRWWTCYTFNGFFYGAHLMGGQFNAGNINLPLPGKFFGGDDVRAMVRDGRCEGSFVGGGLTVGYQWILSKHWNIEVEAGVGYNHVWYDQYPCGDCSPLKSNGTSNYAGLTKLGLAVLYIF